MLKMVIEKRLLDKEGMSHRVQLKPTDPRRISKTLAPVAPPPTKELSKSHKSRKSTS